MLGYLDAEALAATVATGLAHFHSRSRGRLWMKGETSGNTLAVRALRADCDSDALLILADPSGPTCHTGERSCFAAPENLAPAPQGFAWIESLWATILDRGVRRPEGSYTARLLNGGVDAAARKVVEEATEVLMAAKDDEAARRGWPSATGGTSPASEGSSPGGEGYAAASEDSAAATAEASRVTAARLSEEMADLLYHLLVLAAERDVPPSAIIQELRRRHAP